MILVGNQRGGAKDLALHLLKQENEHVEVHEVRGFASHNLMAALNEAYAISRATRCKQFLFSLSLNPPKHENVSTETFKQAIERAEEKLGLNDQPRAIVFHEKNGRRHCHAVWSRIKLDEMKAVQLSFSKRRLIELSRELFLEHGWTMPEGLRHSHARDPRNFTLAEWQQAKRIGKDPKQIKAVFQECWSLSDTQSAFAHGLKQHGYMLARGDRRGFVAVDHRGEVFAVSKWIGIKAKEVRTRLTDEKNLPSVDEARIQIAKDMTARLETLSQEQMTVFAARRAELEEKRQALVRQHRVERQQLLDTQQTFWQDKQQEWRSSFNKGIRSLFDRLTGRRRQIEERNEQDAWQVKMRQQQESDALIFEQLETRRTLQARMERLEALKSYRLDELEHDRSQYQAMREQRLEQLEIQRQEKNRDRPQPCQRGPDWTR
ncbi:relaxase/mobilization nuclease domain-containing protein [Nitrosospira multiformis]|uniref:Relaxase/Mobilisation nuclease domain-containing protein n=1 Tax=Nitrosospira multiformis TaxID=1231 RepID=A0A1I7FTA5_9PROT|nr:relaxase/mobilization nuclease domain-containing protein [Nitrosospira multiformis]SFU39236.1 Relaxase/Mobilisation nuclease domain-containing protein [Nitrosospira multiformis]